MTNLESVKKQKHYLKVCIVKAMVFPVVMYGCESWTVKKAEHRSIDAFKLWCWRRLLKVPWTARRSKQSILKEISPEYALEGPMPKLQYFGHLVQRADSLEKTLMLGKRLKAKGEEGSREWDGYEFEQTPDDSKGQGNLLCCSPWGCKSQIWLSN